MGGGGERGKGQMERERGRREFEEGDEVLRRDNCVERQTGRAKGRGSG